MSDKLTDYKGATLPLPATYQLWPLYGAGFENLGQHGQPISVPLPHYGADELLVRHDATGLCFSDIKVIRLGENHPRIYRDMQGSPVVLGHEVTMTVVGVGDNLREQYRVGDRFIIQSDVFVDGIGYAYGYEIQGGLSQYGIIDQRILNGDHGNYLLPVQNDTGYAESALTEPWACVIAAYSLTYRTGLKAGGTTWIIGVQPGLGPYTISAGFDQASHPDRLLLTHVPTDLNAWLKDRAAALGVEVLEVEDMAVPPVKPIDDIILLGAGAGAVEQVSQHLADFGIVALIAEGEMARKTAVDVGRVHYNHWVYVGGRDPDIARAYSDVPVRSSLRPEGQAWFVGAGGPMGRMHVQRALQAQNPPRTIVCTDVSDARLADLCNSFGPEAQANGIEWLCLNPLKKDEYQATMARFHSEGFDDIIMLAPVPSVISDAAAYLAAKGVMNVFAGVAQGTMVQLDLSDVYDKDVRIIGHSASTIDDLRLMLNQAEKGQLSPNRSVAAVGSLRAARDGMQAVIDTTFPGKIVIYPNIRDMPLTALPDLKDVLPSVYAKLKDGREWTVEAENEFLRQMLP